MTPRMIPAVATQKMACLHYSRFSPISTERLLFPQLLAGSKIENLAANRSSQVNAPNRRYSAATSAAKIAARRRVVVIIRAFRPFVGCRCKSQLYLAGAVVKIT